MARLSPEELLVQLQAYVDDDDSLAPSGLLKARLRKATSKLSRKWEDPSDAIGRVLVTEPVGWMVIRIGCDMGLFTSVATRPKTVDAIAAEANAELAFTTRLLRACHGLNILREVSPGHFGLTEQFQLLGNPTCASSLPLMGSFLHSIYRSMPAFCKENGFCEPRDKNNTALQLAFDAPGQGAFDVLRRDAALMKSIGSVLSVWAVDSAPLQEAYPVQDRLVEGFEGGVFFVDIGGGLGQRSKQLRQAMPHLPGRFVVQDVQISVQQPATEDDSIELCNHDFFKEQPMKGARAYYMRHVLHDWQDDECVQILQRVYDAMTPGYSKLLVHDLVMPETGPPDPWAISSDMDMMSHLAARDRTRSEWQRLFSATPFKEVCFFDPPLAGQEAVIELSK